MDLTYVTKVENIRWNFVKNVKRWAITVGEPEVNKYKPVMLKNVKSLERFTILRVILAQGPC